MLILNIPCTFTFSLNLILFLVTWSSLVCYSSSLVHPSIDITWYAMILCSDYKIRAWTNENKSAGGNLWPVAAFVIYFSCHHTLVAGNQLLRQINSSCLNWKHTQQQPNYNLSLSYFPARTHISSSEKCQLCHIHFLSCWNLLLLVTLRCILGDKHAEWCPADDVSLLYVAYAAPKQALCP